MPRQLPWTSSASTNTTNARTTPVRSNARAQTNSTTKRRRQSPTNKDSNEGDNETPRKNKRFGREAEFSTRTPSTSPPPQPPPIPSPLHQSDLRWIMVEDEFYSTAQLFTQHLHHAEYKRLKHAAASRRAEASANITRPLDPNPRARAEQKIQAEQKVRFDAQRKISANIEDNEKEGSTSASEDDGTVLGDRNLAGLMLGTGTGRVRRKMELGDRSKGSITKTRRAAGFGKQSAGTSKDTNKRAIAISTREDFLAQRSASNEALDEDLSDYHKADSKHSLKPDRTALPTATATEPIAAMATATQRNRARMMSILESGSESERDENPPPKTMQTKPKPTTKTSGPHSSTPPSHSNSSMLQSNSNSKFKLKSHTPTRASSLFIDDSDDDDNDNSKNNSKTSFNTNFNHKHHKHRRHPGSPGSRPSSSPSPSPSPLQPRLSRPTNSTPHNSSNDKTKTKNEQKATKHNNDAKARNETMMEIPTFLM